MALLDDFNRADTGPPPSASWSGPVISGRPGLKVVSNQVAGNAGGQNEAYWNAATYGPDCDASYVVKAIHAAAGFWSGLFLRLQVPGTAGVDGYFIEHQTVTGAANDGWRIYRITDGVFTSIASIFNTDLAVDDTLRFAASGSTLTLYRTPSGGSEATILSTTDATYSAAGYIGMQLESTTARADDFGGGTTVVVAAAPNRIYSATYRRG